MNAKQVLNKIMTLLSKDEEKMATARLTDGTIVESPTFAVGESVEVVTEDGKVPAPDAEHELLVTIDDKEVLIKVTTKDGIITERKVEIVEAEEEKKEEDVEKLAEETEEIKPLDAEKEDMMTKLSYRIDELEKKVKMMEDKKAEMKEDEEEEEDMEDELPKLNGAPVEQKLNKVSVVDNRRIKNHQSSFLSKLYK